VATAFQGMKIPAGVIANDWLSVVLFVALLGVMSSVASLVVTSIIRRNPVPALVCSQLLTMLAFNGVLGW